MSATPTPSARPDLDLRGAIAKSYLAKGLSESFIDRLVSISEVRVIPEGESIVRADEETFDLMLLVEGEGRILTITDEFLGTIRAGMPFGEIAFLDHKPRSSAVVAGLEATVILWPEEKLRDLMAEDPASAAIALHNLCRVLCERLRRANQQIAALLAVEESVLP